VAGVLTKVSLLGVLDGEEVSAAGVGDLELVGLEGDGNAVLEPADLEILLSYNFVTKYKKIDLK
jgi:hypothetical protein